MSALLGWGWRVALVGLVALAILTAGYAGLVYVENLKSELVRTSAELAATALERDIAAASVLRLRAAAAEQALQLTELDRVNRAAAAEWQKVLDELDALPDEVPSDATPGVPLGDLDRLNRAANRLLERASRGAGG